MPFQKGHNKQAKPSDVEPEAVNEPDEAELPPEEEVVEEPSEPESAAPAFVTRLSKNDKATLTKQATARVQEEIRKAERDKFLEAEMERLRQVAGISKQTLGGTHDELVTFKLDLGDESQAFVQLNAPHGKRYYHGHTYTEARHIFNTVNEIGWNGSKLAKQFKGESVYRNRTYGTVVSKNGAVHTGERFN